MGQCLFCNREITESLTLRELFQFRERLPALACQECLRKLPALSGTTTCPGCMRRQESEGLLRGLPELEAALSATGHQAYRFLCL